MRRWQAVTMDGMELFGVGATPADAFPGHVIEWSTEIPLGSDFTPSPLLHDKMGFPRVQHQGECPEYDRRREELAGRLE